MNSLVPANTPYVLVSRSGKKQYGVSACTYQSLRVVVQKKFPGIQISRIVVESDGVEICDDVYLKTLKPNTRLVVLANDESWEPSEMQKSADDNEKKFIAETLRTLCTSTLNQLLNSLKQMMDRLK